MTSLEALQVLLTDGAIHSLDTRPVLEAIRDQVDCSEDDKRKAALLVWLNFDCGREVFPEELHDIGDHLFGWTGRMFRVLHNTEVSSYYTIADGYQSGDFMVFHPC